MQSFHFHAATTLTQTHFTFSDDLAVFTKTLISVYIISTVHFLLSTVYRYIVMKNSLW